MIIKSNEFWKTRLGCEASWPRPGAHVCSRRRIGRGGRVIFDRHVMSARFTKGNQQLVSNQVSTSEEDEKVDKYKFDQRDDHPDENVEHIPMSSRFDV